ncbi:hypothetical protein PsorP6_014829 [Peronosclerospora sorghi]|uniref:Uncharacterized protein n=1 Tax=Peronosclerospora sorghi TaxID=230839 RepID=A0ACC0VTY4_9STRA|nr:hypothetical protein PsorP6_014829 [Peronosclerospora sorghi]
MSPLFEGNNIPQEIGASEKPPRQMPSIQQSMKEIDEESRPYCLKELMPKKKLNSGASSWSEVSYSQSSIKAFTLPRLKGSEQKMIENNLAMHYYIAGSSFQKIEEQHLIDALKIAPPDVQLPSRKQLAGPILDRSYDRMKAETDKALTASDAIGCLTSDASSNVLNESIVNYMIIVDRLSLFFEYFATEEQAHTSDFIAGYTVMRPPEP